MPDPVNFSDRVLIVGPTGSGKTALAQHLFAGFTGARRCAIDPKGRLRLGVPPTLFPGPVDWRQPLAHVVPSAFDRSTYEELYAQAWAAGGPSVTWTDEAGQGIGPTGPNVAPWGLVAFQAQGREVGQGHIACAQRFLTIHTSLRTEAEHVFVFGPLGQRDLDAIAQEIGTVSGDELGARMRDLAVREGVPGPRPYTHLWWQRGGDVHDCAPLPL